MCDTDRALLDIGVLQAAAKLWSQKLACQPRHTSMALHNIIFNADNVYREVVHEKSPLHSLGHISGSSVGRCLQIVTSPNYKS